MKMSIMLAPAIALAAAPCAGWSGDGQGAAPVSLQPGLWETVDVVREADISGVPDEVAAEMRAGLNRPDTSRNCITPQMAADPSQNLRDAMARSGAPGETGLQCTYSDSTYANGVIRIRATCGPVQQAMDGTFTATTADIRLTTSAESPASAGAAPRVLRLRGTSTSRRIGDCPR